MVVARDGGTESRKKAARAVKSGSSGLNFLFKSCCVLLGQKSRGDFTHVKAPKQLDKLFSDRVTNEKAFFFCCCCPLFRLFCPHCGRFLFSSRIIRGSLKYLRCFLFQ